MEKFLSRFHLIEVASVKVDTVSKVFDIKEIIQVDENNKGWWIKCLKF